MKKINFVFLNSEHFLINWLIYVFVYPNFSMHKRAKHADRRKSLLLWFVINIFFSTGHQDYFEQHLWMFDIVTSMFNNCSPPFSYTWKRLKEVSFEAIDVSNSKKLKDFNSWNQIYNNNFSELLIGFNFGLLFFHYS